MFVKNGKNDLLTNKMISLWPYYTSVSGVPESLKNQASPTDGYLLMVLATDDANENNGIYGFNGNEWITFGQPASAYKVPAGNGTTRDNYDSVGDLFLLTDDNTLQVYDGTNWLRGGGGAYPRSGTYAEKPGYVVTGELYWDTDTQSLLGQTGGFWSSVGCKARNGEPALSEGKYSAQMQFRVESGQLYIYTGSQWYVFNGTQVV